MRSELPAGPHRLSLIQGIGFWTRPISFYERNRARYGRRFTVRLPGGPPLVMLSDPAEVKEVFTAPPDVLHPGEGARVLEPVVGSRSVILLDEAAHLEQRKLILPAFHGARMEGLSDLVAEVAEAEVSSWPSGSSAALHPLMQRLTLEIILRAVFGLDPGGRLDALRDRLRRMLAFGDRPISLFPPRSDGALARMLERVGPFATFMRTQREADELLFELIDERRAERGSDRDDVLSILLEAGHEDGSPMTNEELRDELMTLLVAGHETTASTLAWAFERLSGHRDVLARLVAELDAGEADDYLVATIQETLRRRPVLPNAAPRLVMRPLEVGGWTYPAGVCLVPATYLIHHDPELYPDPYAFRPERFLDCEPGTYTWIPFGGGRRRCIGASFAMLEMRIVLSHVLRARELVPSADGVELARRRNITIRPAGGARAVLEQRRPAALPA
jgi:cytochrome P450